MTDNRIDAIRSCLLELKPVELEIFDDSHQHAGHPGAQEGRGHFRVRIVSDAFRNQSTIKRHRIVYDLLDDLMQTDIHALGIVALTPDEAAATSH